MNDVKNLKDALEDIYIELYKAKSAFQLIIETMEPEAIGTPKEMGRYFADRAVEVYLPTLHMIFDSTIRAYNRASEAVG